MCIQRKKANEMGLTFDAVFVNIDEEEKESISDQAIINKGFDVKEISYSPIIYSDE